MQQQDELAEFNVTVGDFDAMLAQSETVELTGPPAHVPDVHFELVGGGLSTYRWRLVAADGEVVAIGAASYRSVEAARRAALAIGVAMRRALVSETPDGPDDGGSEFKLAG